MTEQAAVIARVVAAAVEVVVVENLQQAAVV